MHVFFFFLAMWVTDVVTKRRAFVAAYRGEARLAPCEYPGSASSPCHLSLFLRECTPLIALDRFLLPGESLQNFQWAGEFGDRPEFGLYDGLDVVVQRHLANLEAARCVSFVED